MDSTINGLTALTSPDRDLDLLPVWDSTASTTKKSTLSQVVGSYLNATIVSDGNTLDDILAAVPSAGTTIIIPQGASAASRTLSAADDRTIPLGVEVWVLPGSPIIIPTGRTLKKPSRAIAFGQEYQIFSCQGTGIAKFTYGEGGPISVKWFGAKGTDAIDDTAAIQKALDSVALLGDGSFVDPSTHNWTHEIFFPTGNYVISGPLTVYGNTTIKGAGQYSSRIESSSTGSIFVGYNNEPTYVFDGRVYIRDIWLRGPGKASAVSGAAIDFSTNFAFDADGSGGNNRQIYIDNVYIQGTYDGINVGVCTIGRITNCLVELCARDGISEGGIAWNGIHIANCYSLLNDRHGFYLAGVAVHVNNCYSDGNGGDGFHFWAGFIATLTACGAEANIGSGLYIGNIVALGTDHGAFFTINGFHSINQAGAAPSFWFDGAQNVFISGFHDYATGGGAAIKITQNATTGQNPSNIFIVGSSYAGAVDDTLGVLRTYKDGVFNKMAVSGLLTYADNAAALAGGLVAGDFYRTGTGGVQVVY